MGILQVSIKQNYAYHLKVIANIAQFYVDLVWSKQWMSTLLAAIAMARQEPACASTRMATFKLISAASTPTSMPSGAENGKLLGSSIPRLIRSQVLSRLTITTLRTETFISVCRKSSQASRWRMRMLRALSRRST